ncbi:unnamed protein product [Triticum turgidum subsp. durum]|uniref:Glycosyl transferase 64 domain-containing protein n=1 Tax=Triticum turgidum subsp. durum TaxID=4567 RepID=A0A9R0ZJE1_TRITD|nr:unnamed protein product [Triticum turgidum subsp. durum]
MEHFEVVRRKWWRDGPCSGKKARGCDEGQEDLETAQLRRHGPIHVFWALDRYDLLKRAVAHYSVCAGVDAIHVVWSEPREPPEALRRSVLNCSRAAADVGFVMNRGNSLNNRFRPIQGLRTDAVFSVDDDLVVPCSTLRFAFGVWQSAPSAMVGFVPRMHWPADPRGNTKEYRYGSWWSVWRTGTYSMDLLRFPPMLGRNCEDIAMSFLVANVTGVPPIWVQDFPMADMNTTYVAGKWLTALRSREAFGT